jgi:glutamate racemase
MKSKNDKKIGIFDSGVGGLTVASEIFKILPDEDVIYFGDTARCPYGPRSQKIIQEFSLQNLNFLLSQKVKFVIVACNTSSAFALDFLKERFEVSLMGVIEPGAKAAVRTTENGRIGVIGTVGTISSHSYKDAIYKFDKNVSVFSHPCPLFVPLVEEGFLDKKATCLIAEEYLCTLKKQKIDTLILGCTHYPLLKKVIKEVMGTGVTLIDSAEQIAREVKRFLSENNLSKKTKGKPLHKFFVSDQPEKFIQIGQRFLGKKIKQAQVIDINRY